MVCDMHQELKFTGIRSGNIAYFCGCNGSYGMVFITLAIFNIFFIKYNWQNISDIKWVKQTT